MKRRSTALAIIGALGTMYLAKKMRAEQAERGAVTEQPFQERKNHSSKDKHIYLIGGGIGMLAAAAYLIRDAHIEGKNIHVIEGRHILGGSNDGTGSNEQGFVVRGGRMLNEETFENLWELFGSIPSLRWPNHSVTEEILNFDNLHPTHSQARLVTKNQEIVDTYTMGFSSEDRLAMSKLLTMPEEKLDGLRINDWFGPAFFETNFWYMWQTTFAFQKWSSLFELRRYMNRMILEFSRINTLEGVTRTPLNQYESLILPLKNYLDEHGVDFTLNMDVVDLSFKPGSKITVTDLILSDGTNVAIGKQDIVMMTNGTMTDCSTEGSWGRPAPKTTEEPRSARLWRNIAAKKSGLGNPEPFFGNESETNWQSFTITCRGNSLLKRMEAFSGNIPGSGALMTLKDSSWLMSTVVAAQPHFGKQAANTTVFWGYGIFTDKIGDYVNKTMRECTGEEILYEWVSQMGWQEDWDEIEKDIINVIPVYMPYIDAQFQPRKMSDRPKVVPANSTNFAMISQFVEIPKDMVFTEEYSIRAARIAVYKLFDVNKRVIPVTPYNRDPKVLAKAMHTMFR
ncbi:oleate hydratase [Enterococcus sp. BWR-S5]|uniref:oleate hydratase n=1 Tax=Enterococcus sp. BWR-S5 TaxID=2787714 RepID=UPI001F00FE9F|nr:oleate hydratase [Enterococcus sp. BWR-S5]MBL1225781.1 oleate hydratase [Enterococcus sp. BWR-S5]